MTDVQLRFLRAIADRIDPARIAELHLFPPMKQGVMESGVAVIAAEEAETNAEVVVYSASYRLHLKGIERGKWETEIKAEADAPLVTVDDVVRGVQRRGGEGAEPERFSGERLREVLEIDPATGTPWPART